MVFDDNYIVYHNYIWSNISSNKSGYNYMPISVSYSVLIHIPSLSCFLCVRQSGCLFSCVQIKEAASHMI